MNHRFLVSVSGLVVLHRGHAAGDDAGRRPGDARRENERHAGEGVHCRRARRTASPICRASGPTPPTRRSSGRRTSPRSSTRRGSARSSSKRRPSARASRPSRARSPTCTTTSPSSGWTGARATIALNLRTSLIVDPPDGKIPPLTAGGTEESRRARGGEKAHGRRRTDAVAEHADRRRAASSWTAPAADADAGLQQQLSDRAGSGYVMILAEMIHDVRIIPLDGRPQPAAERPAVDGQLARPLGGQDAGRRDHELQRQEPRSRGSSENMTCHRALHARGRRHDPLQFTVEDPTTWTRPWTAEVPLQKTDRSDLRARLPRRQLRLANTLAGARAEEKRAAEEAAKKIVEIRRDIHANEASRCGCRRRSAAGRGAGVGASRLFGGVRRQQADEAEGNAHEVGNDQSRTRGSTST